MSQPPEATPAPSPETASQVVPVLRWCETDAPLATVLLARFGIETRCLDPGTELPGSYWGESEAGLVANRVFVRPDTPLHSAFHEACHYICMDQTRRALLNTDAGGDFAEEDAVCYLQILLSDQIPGFGRARMLADMDAWGYTFRLGSARAWFEQDAEDARDWLRLHGLIDEHDRPTWRVRA
jgi:hypothetical protein